MGLRLHAEMTFSTLEFSAPPSTAGDLRTLYVHPATKVAPKGMLGGEAFLVAYGTGVTWTRVGLDAASQ